MSDDLLPRPEPPRPVAERIRAWIEWWGVSRLVASAVSVVVVCVGVWWLVRSPNPPPESSLPTASPVEAPAATSPTTAGAPTTTGDVGAATSGSIVPAGRVVVHVAGEVAWPGVYEFPAGERVADAVERAGGATTDADLDRVNLAAPLVDASQVYVPAVDEEWTAPAPQAVVADGDGSNGAPPGPVDVNRAGSSELESLPGVGPATAEAIITERERNGPFLTVDDLDRVPGIGPAKLDALRDLVTV